VGAQGTGEPDRRVAAVAMPHTPGASDLPGAEAELAALRRRLPGEVSSLVGPKARWETVHAALRDAAWAHFACHAAADMDDPSRSQLLLADHQEHPLTVVDVARLRLDDAELAFLSACSTARPGTRLTDEAIHLASAFQLAGYRHVIGTLWPIDDKAAVAIADDIYTTLATSTDNVAGAVHAATRRLRNRSAATPSVWASHIHVGA
jgi:CHAT domain-containing protein